MWLSLSARGLDVSLVRWLGGGLRRWLRLWWRLLLSANVGAVVVGVTGPFELLWGVLRQLGAEEARAVEGLAPGRRQGGQRRVGVVVALEQVVVSGTVVGLTGQAPVGRVGAVHG